MNMKKLITYVIATGSPMAEQRSQLLIWNPFLSPENLTWVFQRKESFLVKLTRLCGQKDSLQSQNPLLIPKYII